MPEMRASMRFITYTDRKKPDSVMLSGFGKLKGCLTDDDHKLLVETVEHIVRQFGSQGQLGYCRIIVEPEGQ